MGGAEAYYAAEQTGLPAYTFNAIYLPKDISPQPNYAYKEVTNLFAYGETFSGLFSLSERRVGNQRNDPPDIKSIYEIPSTAELLLHSIVNFAEGLGILSDFYKDKYTATSVNSVASTGSFVGEGALRD